MKTIKTIADIDPTIFNYAKSATGTAHRRGSKKFNKILNRIYRANLTCIVHDSGDADWDNVIWDLHIALRNRVSNTHNAMCSVALQNGVPASLEYIYYYYGETYSLWLTNTNV